MITAQSKTVYKAKEPRGYLPEMIWGDDKEILKYKIKEEAKMGENKNLEQLRKELEHAKKEKLQAEHQLQRKKNQLSYRENFSRKERSHRLIICGAIFEKYFPLIKGLSEKELSDVLSMTNINSFASELEKAIDQVRREVTE